MHRNQVKMSQAILLTKCYGTTEDYTHMRLSGWEHSFSFSLVSIRSELKKENF